MEKLVGLIILLFLACGLLTVAAFSAPLWGTALLINLGMGLLMALARAMMIRRPGPLAKIINARWDENASTLHWRADPSAVEKQSLALPLVLFSSLPGVLYLFTAFPAFFAEAKFEGNDISDASFLKVIIALMVLGGVCVAGTLNYKMANAFCAASVRGVLKHFSIGAEQFEKLGEAEAEIRSLCDEIGVTWPPGMSEDINEYIQREKESLLVNGRAFRNHVESALEQARADAENLRAANRFQQQTLSAFKEAARAANRAGAITLIKEMESLHEAITSENMMSLLVERRWDEYVDIHREMAADVERISRQAEEYDSAESEAPPISHTAPGETPLQKAFRVLGVNGGMSREAIKQSYRQLAKDYHPDKAGQATEAIRTLAAERFKEIQEAWEIIKREMHIV